MLDSHWEGLRVDSYVLLQILVNVILGSFIYGLWLRLKKPPQDDPRLSKGLQLLQSKISVLEDLSDRTEVQVQQLVSLLDHKAKAIQQKVDESRQQINLIEQSMLRSREVAKIFQDKIPHQEIIDRQNTIKYVKAAQWAHAGKTAAEIAQMIDLPVGEIEFICKVNKDQLMFDTHSLPEWAKDSNEMDESKNPDKTGVIPDPADAFVFKETADDFEFKEKTLSQEITSLGSHEYPSLKKVGEDFRQACREYEKKQEVLNSQMESGGIINSARVLKDKIRNRATSVLQERGLDFQETDVASVPAPSGLEIYLPEVDGSHKMEEVVSENIHNEFTLKKESASEHSTLTTFKLDHHSNHLNEPKDHRVIRKVEFPRIEK